MKKSLNLCCISLLLVLISCQKEEPALLERTVQTLQEKILDQAIENVKEEPITVTAAFSVRSKGGVHDFFSEGDYWWPDPGNPTGPYIRRDGQSNPENFLAHRKALMRFSEIVVNLTSAFLITGDTHYVRQIKAHCNKWFVNDSSKMNPHLL